MEIKNTPKRNVVNFKKKKINCPTCKKASMDSFTPFCSKKCSDLDLMKWLSDENYINFEQKK
tara:strand:- start:119 stop:304 length:186 start_codon:yes stop_codon:yes gene_type:complete